MNGSEKNNKGKEANIDRTERFGHPGKKKRHMIFAEVVLGLICALMSFFFHIMIEKTVF